MLRYLASGRRVKRGYISRVQPAQKQDSLYIYMYKYKMSIYILSVYIPMFEQEQFGLLGVGNLCEFSVLTLFLPVSSCI